MKTMLALTSAALIALTGPALAGAHNNAADNENRAAAGQAAVDKVPAGLGREGSPGVGPATTKGGNSDKGDE